jgi:uncharacterized OB-fold protein
VAHTTISQETEAWPNGLVERFSNLEPALAPSLKPFVQRDGQGAPYLAGSTCNACGHVYVGQRYVCARCATRGQMSPCRLAESGRVYVHTIVHRSFPGVPTPFIDVIVDLDDGAHLKGTLLGVRPDPGEPFFDLPVKVVFFEEQPVNMPGAPHLTYAFEPIVPSDGGSGHG